MAIVDHDGGEVLHLEPADGLRAQVLVGDDLELLHERDSTAPAPPMAPKYTARYCLSASFTGWERSPLPMVPLSPSRKQRRGEPVHPAAGGGPDGADDLAGARRRGSGVVDDLAADVDRKRLARLGQREQPPVGGVARGVEHAGDADAIPRLERLDVGVAQRRLDLLDPVAPS